MTKKDKMCVLSCFVLLKSVLLISCVFWICTQTDTEDDHPILHREVEAAVQSLKKGKSAGVNNIPAELVQAGGEDVITALTTVCNKIWQKGNGQPHGPSP